MQANNKDERRFYIYLYLDSRKPGMYKYGPYEFDYEPFYAGKGSTCRIESHMYKKKLEKNTPKNAKIKKLLRLGLEPIQIKYVENLTEREAFDDYEIPMIAIIGRKDQGKGPLLNLTDGGEGNSGSICTEKRRRQNSRAAKILWEDPEFVSEHKKRASKLLSDMWEDPTYREKKTKELQDMWKDEEFKSRMSEIRKIVFNTEEYKENRSKCTKVMWESEEYRDKILKTRRGGRNGKAKAIVIDGIYYSYMKEFLSKGLLSVKLLKNRLKSEEYPNYKYATEEEINEWRSRQKENEVGE